MAASRPASFFLLGLAFRLPWVYLCAASSKEGVFPHSSLPELQSDFMIVGMDMWVLPRGLRAQGIGCRSRALCPGHHQGPSLPLSLLLARRPAVPLALPRALRLGLRARMVDCGALLACSSLWHVFSLSWGLPFAARICVHFSRSSVPVSPLATSTLGCSPHSSTPHGRSAAALPALRSAWAWPHPPLLHTLFPQPPPASLVAPVLSLTILLGRAETVRSFHAVRTVMS